MEQKTEASQAVDERQSMMEALSMCIDALDGDTLRHVRMSARANAVRVLARAALKAQPAPTESQGDVLAGYTKWMHDSSNYPHSDDMRHPFEAFKAGSKWAQLSGNPGELANKQVLENIEQVQDDDSARLDAERYRWMRVPANHFMLATSARWNTADQLDAIIDRARASAETGGVKP